MGRFNMAGGHRDMGGTIGGGLLPGNVAQQHPGPNFIGGPPMGMKAPNMGGMSPPNTGGGAPPNVGGMPPQNGGMQSNNMGNPAKYNAGPNNMGGYPNNQQNFNYGNGPRKY
ncbi:hypothetical protein Leryth_015924 [Lithospermum erythrorhizon]|nr:hypothetical protein Leryth_015924 [Lithospermum erythrorhizon]